MKVFLDTNILVDLGDKRQEATYAEAILQLGESGAIHLCASYLSYANMGYIWRKKPLKEKYSLIRDLLVGIDVLPMDFTQLQTAVNNEAKDYEDMLQYQCALAANCDVIVTNNTKDFKAFSKLPYMTSRDFLLYFFSEQRNSNSPTN